MKLDDEVVKLFGLIVVLISIILATSWSIVKFHSIDPHPSAASIRDFNDLRERVKELEHNHKTKD